jgi:hypothetical protein
MKHVARRKEEDNGTLWNQLYILYQFKERKNSMGESGEAIWEQKVD